MRGPRRVTLRSVLFHHIADEASTFTEGLGVRMTEQAFVAVVERIVGRYRPVSLAEVHAAVDRDEALPRRAVLVTFDDAYASVAERAGPILEGLGVPSVFFVNGGFVDHAQLGTDNLVAHVTNTAGPAALERAVARVRPVSEPTVTSVLRDVVPSLPLTEVDRLRDAIIDEIDHDPCAAAEAEGLYLSSAQLAALPSSMVIGSHTLSHVRCRVLRGDELSTQIDGNRRLLADLTGSEVGPFSVPYGSAVDFTPSVRTAVDRAGHRLSFLVEGRLNHGPLGAGPIMRVSLGRSTPFASWVELEVLPRLRYVRELARGAA